MADELTSELATTWGAGDRPARPERPPEADELPRGERLGRYLILRTLGAGAMGVVHEAYDPELERKVAVKLLRARADDTDHTRRARLIREARAIAKLSHPNVVGIYDVGAAGERVFIAMELVAGVELGRWLRARPRGWREVREVFVRAGHGLAAAHAAGLVHRDFKPANVLVGDDGGVRVLDFGLARPDDAGDGSVGDPLAALREPGVTFAGGVAGTPAYMAPEVHAGATADARADQYAFCVALYEALAGARPFAGDTPVELLAAKRGPPPRAGLRRAPRWLRRIVLRGLAVDPAQRFAGMPELLAALQADPARRLGLAAAAGLLVIAGVAAVVGAGALAERRLRPCLKGQEEVAAVWSDARRGVVRDALLATGVPYAPRVWQAVAAAIDEYTDDWKDMYESACTATAVDGVQSQALLDLRMACLRGRLAEVDALARVFAQADAELVAQATEGVSRLTPLAGCADTGALLAQVEPPADERTAAAVAAVRQELIEAEALERAGRYEAGLERARAAEARAADAGYDPALAEARLRLGALLEYAGRFADAELALADAAERALASGHDLVAGQAGALAVFVAGYRRSDLAAAKVWRALAEAALRRAGGDRRERALLAGYWGAALEQSGDLAGAQGAYEQALAEQEELLGPDHLEVAQTLNNLGAVLGRRGDAAASTAAHTRALQLRERALGPDHPAVATSLNNLGVTMMGRGEFAAAEPYLTRALQIRERALGPTHPDVANLHTNLGALWFNLGDHERALAAYDAALAGSTRDAAVAHVLQGIGVLRMQRGEWAAAEASFRGALAARERALGPTHPDIAPLLSNLGRTLRAVQRCDEARALHARALELREAVGVKPAIVAVLADLGAAQRCAGRLAEARASYLRGLATLADDTPSLERFTVLAGLGRTELELDESAALAHLEQALALASHLRVEPVALAELRWALARALWSRPADRARALQLAREAHEALAAAGERGRPALAEVVAWLASHGGDVR